MEWSLEIGRNLEHLRRVEEQTGKTPAMLMEQPLLDELLDLEWEAFDVLNRGRQVGFNGPQPIAVSEMVAFCQLNCIGDDTERTELVRYIQQMDAVYLKWHKDHGGRNS